MMKNYRLIILFVFVLNLVIGCGKNDETNHDLETEQTTEVVTEIDVDTELNVESETETENSNNEKETESTTNSENFKEETETTTNQSNSDMVWYDEQGFYYCMSNKRIGSNGELYYTGYIVAPATGFRIEINDYLLEIEGNDFRKNLANAGYYNYVWDPRDGGTTYNYSLAMLVEYESNMSYEKWDNYYNQFVAYAQEHGATQTYNMSGNGSNIYDSNGNMVYVIQLDVYKE